MFCWSCHRDKRREITTTRASEKEKDENQSKINKTFEFIEILSFTNKCFSALKHVHSTNELASEKICASCYKLKQIFIKHPVIILFLVVSSLMYQIG